ncbi:helix-turn-helix domain-containing protein [Paenibacillus hodogayensis]|uniref:Helix-turn-helix domain-containing protein n=1 Tax=Paenibacillus hodogayensis TaxID=279208 RepID=A0ABV5W7R6_9BACL
MGKFHQLRQNANSLFMKLLFSFMAIIVLLISFNFLSYTFFRNNVTNEILRYNNLNLDKTVSDYEKHLSLIRKVAFSIYFSSEVDVLRINSPRIQYEVAGQIRQNIRNMLGNDNLYLNNIILYFRETGFIIEKEGTTLAESMFSKFYRSPAYSYDFWKEEFNQPYSYKAYPASSFTDVSWENWTSKGYMIPYVIKDNANAKLMIIAMLDANSMFTAFHQSINRNFLVLNEQGETLFSSVDPNQKITLDQLTGGKGHLKVGTDYYFYSKGPSGNTYINIVPNAGISSQIIKLNVILVSLLVLAIVISIGASILFSIRMNNPLKKIVQTIQELNQSPTAPNNNGSIKEFALIGDRLTNLLQTNRIIHEDLRQKNSQLQYYAYTNKLKMIRTGGLDWKEPIVSEKPFVLIVFDITFRQRYFENMETDSDFAAYFLKEYISTALSHKYQETTVFQMEKNQIVALVFPQAEEPAITDSLREMKQIFDRDQHYCFLTIAVSPVYPDSSRFTQAYEQATSKLKQRSLGEDTQIIADERKQSATFQAFTLMEEQEFHANLHAGNGPAVVQQTLRMLCTLNKKQASAQDFADFSKHVLNKVLCTLAALQLEGRLAKDNEAPQTLLADCHTLAQYESFWTGFLGEATGWIKQKKEARDPITSFVFDYLDTHYGDDLSLELLADKLNITGAYLSTYFKDKTGMNFSDYLNGMRVNIAKDMLQNSNLKIQDVAVQVGYQNVNSFIRMFKRYAGLPPGEFRKTAQQDG